jgi:FkbM family methyltransferase
MDQGEGVRKGNIGVNCLANAPVPWQPAAMTTDIPAFGTYSPSGAQAKAIGFARGFDPGPLSKLAASIAKRLIWPTLNGPLDVTTWGIAMRVDPRRNITEKRLLLSPSRFELEERRILEACLKAGDRFVDVGANIGAYTLWVAKIIGPMGQGIAIEPQPTVLARLRANIALNREFNVTVFACGAGPADASMKLSIGSTNEGGASMATREGGGDSVEVAIRPLLDMVMEAGFDRIDALKIDIEGFEDQALMPFFNSAPKSLWPKLLILERSDKDWADDLMGLLKASGYKNRHVSKRNYVMDLT